MQQRLDCKKTAEVFQAVAQLEAAVRSTGLDGPLLELARARRIGLDRSRNADRRGRRIGRGV